MTDVPSTADDLIDRWSGTAAPIEPSPTIHPSMLPPALRIMRVIGSPWEAHEQRDGTWTFLANGEVIWSDVAGRPEDAFRLLLDVHRDPIPEAGGAPPTGRGAGDRSRIARGMVVGLAWCAAFWVALWVLWSLAG